MARLSRFYLCEDTLRFEMIEGIQVATHLSLFGIRVALQGPVIAEALKIWTITAVRRLLTRNARCATD